MKDSPQTPLEKTGDWIEYVLRHGGARHLRAQVFNIPWYHYYLLDLIAFLVSCCCGDIGCHGDNIGMEMFMSSVVSTEQQEN